MKPLNSNPNTTKKKQNTKNKKKNLSWLKMKALNSNPSTAK
jgi:hypothetical protein